MKDFIYFLECKRIRELAKKAGIDVSKFDDNELKMGFEVEKEHDDGSDVDVVNNDTDLVKITVSHLREDPKYYSKLKKVEEK